MTATDESANGRERQRRRTRRAIVAAAAELIAKGESPSIADVADAADVAKRTVYTYFATIDHLMADAALELSRRTVEPTFDSSTDPTKRLAAFVRSMARGSADTEELGRTIIRLTLGAPPDAGNRRRGYRRVEWIERALEPVRDRLTPAGFERLVSAMATVVGWESFLVLRDVRGLGLDEIEGINVWMATALLTAALAEG
ncbi:MAG: TetR family transcriptional regulator [Pseudonocardiales bacterium]|nr:TetR family transcriptional regulator [Pseudonocardiales bacterium]